MVRLSRWSNLRVWQIWRAFSKSLTDVRTRVRRWIEGMWDLLRWRAWERDERDFSRLR
jgi:hypothetical protein